MTKGTNIGIQSRSLTLGNDPSQPVITTCHTNSIQADLGYLVDNCKQMTLIRTINLNTNNENDYV